MLKKCLVFCLSLILSMSAIHMVAFANNDKSITIQELNGNIFKNGENINYESKAAYNVNVQQLELSYVGNKFKIKGKLNCGTDKANFATMGDFYPVIGGGVYDDKVILGDFKDTGRYNFAQIKVFSNCPMGDLLSSNKDLVNGYAISMSIEDMNNGELYYVQGKLNAIDYNKILALSKDQINSKMSNGQLKKDIDNTTLGLFNAKNKFLKRTDENQTRSLTNQTAEQSYELPVPAPVDVKVPDEDVLNIQGVSVSLTELNNFLNDIKTKGTVNASSYSSTIKSIMMQTGWNSYQNPVAPAYFYYCYGFKNGSSDYMLDISLFDWTNSNSTAKNPSTQIYLRQGMVIDYDTLYGQYKLVYLNAGIYLSNIQLTTYGCSGDNVFTSRTIAGVFQTKGSIYSVIMSLIPYASTVYSAFEGLTAQGSTTTLGQIFYFDSTAALQKQRWNGKVVRGIIGDFSSNTIEREGQYCNLTGTTCFAMSTTYFNFKFTVNSNI